MVDNENPDNRDHIRLLTEQLSRMLENLNAVRQTTPVLGEGREQEFKPVLYNQVNDQNINQNNFQVSHQRSNSKHESD